MTTAPEWRHSDPVPRWLIDCGPSAADTECRSASCAGEAPHELTWGPAPALAPQGCQGTAEWLLIVDDGTTRINLDGDILALPRSSTKCADIEAIDARIGRPDISAGRGIVDKGALD